MKNIFNVKIRLSMKNIISIILFLFLSCFNLTSAKSSTETCSSTCTNIKRCLSSTVVNCNNSDQVSTTNFKPSITNNINCGSGGYLPSNYAITQDPLNTQELYIVSAYEGQYINCQDHSFNSHPQGEISINISSTEKPVVLALGAYEPVLWKINLLPGANLAKVITSGYYIQEICGIPTNILVEHLCPSNNACSSSKYQWEIGEDHLDNKDYREFISLIRNHVQLIEKSYQGCYSGKVFNVPNEALQEVTLETFPFQDDGLGKTPSDIALEEILKNLDRLSEDINNFGKLNDNKSKCTRNLKKLNRNIDNLIKKNVCPNVSN